ncbi:MAG: hypothetical protein ACRCU3_08510 [Eubacteriaceae bacterium]
MKNKLFSGVCLILSLFLVFPSMLFPPKAEAGATEYFIDRVADDCIEYIERSIVVGLDEASSNNTLPALEVINHLLKSGEEVKTDQVIDLCNDILIQLDQIQQDIAAIDSGIQQTIAELTVYEIQENVSEKGADLSQIRQKYIISLVQYQKYLNSAKTYATLLNLYNQGNATLDEKNSAYDNAMTEKLRLENSFQDLNYLTDIDALAKLACRNYPSRGSQQGYNPTGSITYLDEVKTLCEKTIAFDHQYFEPLCLGINESIIPFLTIVMSNRIYVDYMSAEEKSTGLMTKDFEDCGNAASNAIEDIVTQQQSFLDTTMRPYDIDYTTKIAYTSSGNYKNNYYVAGTPFSYEYTSMADQTKTTGDFYRVKVGNSFFLILKYKNPISELGLIDYQKVTNDLGPDSHYGFPSQDFYNLNQTFDNDYQMISQVSDLSNMVSSSPYKYAGNFYDYLTKCGGLLASTLPPESKDCYIVTSQWAEPSLTIVESAHEKFFSNYQWINAQTLTPDTPETAVEDVLMCPPEETSEISTSGRRPFILLKGKIPDTPFTLSSQVNDPNYGQLTLTDKNGHPLTNSILGGTKIFVHTKQNEKTSLTNLRLIKDDGSGVFLEELSDKALNDSRVNEAGESVYSFTMPYQNAIVDGIFSLKGSPEDPFTISNFDELNYYFTQMEGSEAAYYANASYRVTQSFSANNQSLPSNFRDERVYTGTFDGGGYTISDLNIDGRLGFFRFVDSSGVIKNLNLENFSGNGGLAQSNDGLIENCHILSGSLKFSDGDIAGIAANNNETGTIRNCSVVSEMEGDAIAGLVSDNRGILENSFSRITFKGYTTAKKMSSIAQRNPAPGRIENVYTVASYPGEIPKEGNSDINIGDGIYKNIYYQSHENLLGRGTPMTQDKMKAAPFKDTLNQNKTNNEWLTWGMTASINDGYPGFFPSDPVEEDEEDFDFEIIDGVIQIPNYEKLRLMSHAVKESPQKYAGAKYFVTQDIICNNEDWSQPIGSLEHPFTGEFNGNYKTLRGITMHINADAVGLFGVIGVDGKVENYGLYQSTALSTGSYLGGFVGINQGTLINCFTGVAQLSGGFVDKNGHFSDLSILNTYVTGNTAGGIAGQNSGTLLNCHTGADVNGNFSTGGIVGENSGLILNSYAMGKVDNTKAGGIAGTNTGEINTAYFCGATPLDPNAQGITPDNQGTISEAYFLNTNQGTNGTPLSMEEMKSDAFTSVLNASSTKSRNAEIWVRENSTNHGYPTLNSNALTYSSRTLIDPVYGIQLTGEVLTNAQLLALKQGEESLAYQSIAKALPITDQLNKVFDLMLLVQGAPTNAFKGDFSLSFPRENLSLNKIVDIYSFHNDTVTSYQSVTLDKESYTISHSKLSSFGIATRGNEDNQYFKANGIRSNPKTGVNFFAFGAFIFLSILSLSFIFFKKAKGSPENE